MTERYWQIALVVSGLTLSACTPMAETGPYPTLQPIDSLLAEADMAFTDPGPAQVQRAARLKSRAAALTP